MRVMQQRSMHKSRIAATALMVAAVFVIPAQGFANESSTGESTTATAIYNQASPSLAMHGQPALPDDFTHYPYVNPTAPKGGALVLGERGSFDSLHPYLVRGRWVWSVKEHVIESLMARSFDEPFSLYGLLAERVHTPEDRSEVSFFLNPAARFSTGDPVTIDDVIWTLESLRDFGRPYFGATYGQVAQIERLGERGVRFVFEKPNRELPLLLGLMPVLSKNAFNGSAFDEPGDAPIIGSGPYTIENVEMGRSITLKRNPDYWGSALAVNIGRNNVDHIQTLYFRDQNALWEAFTSGEIHAYTETDPTKWVNAYTFPRAESGDVEQSEIKHRRPSGMNGFVFNTRKKRFADRRVRQAFALVFDYAWVNKRYFEDQEERITSYFSGSELGFTDPIPMQVRNLLEPYKHILPPKIFTESCRPPAGAGDGRNRRNAHQALKLLAEAGWTVQDGVLKNAQGDLFRFEILLTSAADQRLPEAFVDMLKSVGVQATIRSVDSSQYSERLNDYDFDMIIRRWALSLSPGEEQRFYWGSAGRDTPGTRNYMGAYDPVIDAMIDALLAAGDRHEFVTAARALDRVLSCAVYVIPWGRSDSDLIAHAAFLRHPEKSAIYGAWPKIWPDAWWIEQ